MSLEPDELFLFWPGMEERRGGEERGRGEGVLCTIYDGRGGGDVTCTI